MIEDIEVVNCPTCLGFWIGVLAAIIVLKSSIMNVEYAVLVPLFTSLGANLLSKLNDYYEIITIDQFFKDKN